MSEYLTRAAFESHLNTMYRMSVDGDESIDLVLVEANDKTPERFDGEQFSLIFKGPPERYIPQQICPLDHPAMGRLNLFLVPVEQKKDGFYYEAFFNRAAAPEE